MKHLTSAVSALLGWFGQNGRELPWRRTRDPYGIWVSEVMLQQTQVKTVLPYWERWMRALPTIATLANAKPGKIHKLWEGLGYYTRVRNLQKAAQIIMAEHDGRFPETFDEVLALPGIGRYTAGAICSIAFNQPRPILDGNVIRVLTRWLGIVGDPRERRTNATLWRMAEDLVIEASALGERNAESASCDKSGAGAGTGPALCSHFNQALMELGALVCTARRADCGVCPLAKGCVARQQGLVEELPNLKGRTPATRRRFVAFVLRKGDRFLVRQRPAGVVNAHLWEFPNLEVAETGEAGKPKSECRNPKQEQKLKRAAWRALGVSAPKLEPFCTIRHSITRYRIAVEVFRMSDSVRFESSRAAGLWLRLSRLRRLPFASAHKKILERLGEQDPRHIQK